MLKSRLLQSRECSGLSEGTSSDQLRFPVGFLGRVFTKNVAGFRQTDDAEGNVDKSDTALDFLAYCPGKSLSTSPFLWCLGESD